METKTELAFCHHRKKNPAKYVRQWMRLWIRGGGVVYWNDLLTLATGTVNKNKHKKRNYTFLLFSSLIFFAAADILAENVVTGPLCDGRLCSLFRVNGTFLFFYELDSLSSLFLSLSFDFMHEDSFFFPFQVLLKCTYW